MTAPPPGFLLGLLPMAGLAEGLPIAGVIRPTFGLGCDVIHLSRANEAPFRTAQAA